MKAAGAAESSDGNPLRQFATSRTSGPGLHKWAHYYDIYHRHLSKFRGRAVRMVEIGIQSGGSLDMWPHYFGAGLDLHGVDIDPGCKQYERPGVTVHIGDQTDRHFWADLRSKIGPVDVLLDDGGHTSYQQRVTLEEWLAVLAPGGVFICEDIHGRRNRFSGLMGGLADEMHAGDFEFAGSDGTGDRLRFAATPFQSRVSSIHTYPFLTVIETREQPVAKFVSRQHGDQWRPPGDVSVKEPPPAVGS